MTHERIKGRVRTTEDWRREHDPHRTNGTDHAREKFDHPSGTWFWLVCSCGAKHLLTKEEDGE